MAGMHKETIYDKSLGVVAKMLREEAENVTRAPLPKRWVELILHLDEQERKNFEGSKATRDEYGAREVSDQAD